MLNINPLLKENTLFKLIQPENFVGWVYRIDYDHAHVMTNDLWKSKTAGIPHNSFLLATAINPENLASVSENDQEILLLRVVGTSRLPQDDDLVRVKIDSFQNQTDSTGSAENRQPDHLTRSQLQFGGLECTVLGTFFIKDNDFWLGSDLESFSTSSRLTVYRPRGEALKLIVNYIDPIRKAKAENDAQKMGLKTTPPPIRIGTVRFTSTDRLHRKSPAEHVSVSIHPFDFLARRTAVLGMTRTGKSNMVKKTVAVVRRVAREGEINIGQIIYDLNGEYANINSQDEGSLAEVFPNDTIRYSMSPPRGKNVEDLRSNFYDQHEVGFSIIQRELADANRVTSDYIRAFINMSLDEPPSSERGDHNRWEVLLAAYKTLLYKAGFSPPNASYKVTFPANGKIRDKVASSSDVEFNEFTRGTTTYLNLSLAEAEEWFIQLRALNQIAEKSGHKNDQLKTSSGKDFVSVPLKNLLNMIAQKSDNGSYISGYSILAEARKYHSPKRTQDVAEEIYSHLKDGKIVILDLSVGEATAREKISIQIAQKIFSRSMNTFTSGKRPPNIVIYIEEAHNLIGKGMDLTETWPRLAKEGAKYQIALVYATQEVSSIHPNILSNTENWFITHLNNDREVRELARFYDFADFSRSLIRAQDVGFARVKTLSGPFVIPVQIDLFDPEYEKAQQTDFIRPKDANPNQESLFD